jgi:hypothetical protein
MMRPIKILLQTTIPETPDDWSIARFSLLSHFLQGQRDERGNALFEVTARNRDALGAPDRVLSSLDQSEFDEMWLFAVDTGEGLTSEDCGAISGFRRSGRGLMVTRDHMDLGSSICTLVGVGAAHHFHSRNIDSNALRQPDDPHTTYISWPNFHSGANGDYQEVDVAAPAHPVLINPASPTGVIRYLPCHPHEGAVSAPPRQAARVIAKGISKATGRPFNIAVAFESENGYGRAIAQSTFHHFADYNWDTRKGAPSFVDEPPGDGILRSPEALADTLRYVRNVALWLGGKDAADLYTNPSFGAYV